MRLFEKLNPRRVTIHNFSDHVLEVAALFHMMRSLQHIFDCLLLGLVIVAFYAPDVAVGTRCEISYMAVLQLRQFGKENGELPIHSTFAILARCSHQDL